MFRLKGTQGMMGLLAPCEGRLPLAVLFVGLLFTLSRRVRKRLRARQDAGSVHAVKLDSEAWTGGCRVWVWLLVGLWFWEFWRVTGW